MPRSPFRGFLLAIAFVVFSATTFAGDKKVTFTTIPPGAEVEVNGSITCTTPCSIDVPGYYFGDKHTVFSKHAVTPITVRLLKDGYAPKTIQVTTGPLHWKSLNGVNGFDYYLVTSTVFNIRLDAASDFFPKPESQPLPTTKTVSLPSENNSNAPVMENEDIVKRATPAIVVVSTTDGWGSGFFISPKGVVVTNAHVVRGFSTASVTLSTGKTMESSEIYVDADRDLALIKLPDGDYPFLKISEHLPNAGADVLAIGSPGIGAAILTDTVTRGIVSGVRETDAGTWIQTDAAINHGNSGGPLLDKKGEVVGVNTLRASPSEFSGMNFSLSGIEITKMMYTKFGVRLGGDAAPRPSGSVSLTSNPSGADIEVDGVFVGTTPAELPVNAGERTITIVKKGFNPFQRKMQVVAGAKQTVSAELESNQTTETASARANQPNGENVSQSFGNVTITSEPTAADVYIDDSFQGKTPVTLKLKPGKHFARLFSDGYMNWSQQISVEAGGDSRVTATLRKPN